MARNDLVKHIWAGIFSIIGVIVVCGSIFFIGYQKGFSQPQFEVVVLFDKVGGLMEGSAVRLSGVNVGTTKSIDFLDEEVMERGVKVTLTILKRYEKQLRQATQISIQTEGVLGARYVEIGRNSGDEPIDIREPVIGEPMLDVYDLAAIIENTASSFEETTKGINAMMVELKYISRKTKRLLDRIEQRVIDGNLIKVF
ncbi:MAG: MCE family protein [Candidatus Omnitrophica bacterium]|nr:MCE family protein [Candidatus Omnitrophota bacterium]